MVGRSPSNHDVRDGESSKRLREKALGGFGRVDILVNNAGVGPKPGPVRNITDEEYDRVMNVNALTHDRFCCCSRTVRGTGSLSSDLAGRSH